MTKSELQDRAVKLLDNHNNIVLEWATGTGKSLGALKIIQKILLNDPNKTGLLVCKESTHLDNWDEEINEHNMGYIMNNTDTILYASLHKYNKHVDYLILDEVHALTWKRMGHLKKIIDKTTIVIGLSATIPDDKKYILKYLCKGHIRYATVNLTQAITLKLLPQPKIFIHKKSMTSAQALRYNTIMERMDYFKEAGEMKNLKMEGLKRKRFIASCKTEYAKTIIKSIRAENKRFICFAGSIRQAKALSDKVFVSSKQHKRENALLIKNFNENLRHDLFAVRMMRESINLTNIESGLIIQIDSKSLSFYQMLGRCLRHEKPEMHVLQLVDTHDEVYFDNIITDELKKYIEYV